MGRLSVLSLIFLLCEIGTQERRVVRLTLWLSGSNQIMRMEGKNSMSVKCHFSYCL